MIKKDSIDIFVDNFFDKKNNQYISNNVDSVGNLIYISFSSTNSLLFELFPTHIFIDSNCYGQKSLDELKEILNLISFFGIDKTYNMLKEVDDLNFKSKKEIKDFILSKINELGGRTIFFKGVINEQ